MAERTRLPIVGIGASAGGLEALEGLFGAMPDAPGMAFVVLTHLAEGRESLLVELLARHTAMPVHPATDGVTVERDHIYVLMPGQFLTIHNGRLHARTLSQPQRERNLIDMFFISLAEDQGENAICMVLSGAGSDGTLGVKAVRELGGLTLAQGTDHSAPRHDSMPASAVAGGGVDLVLPVEEIGTRLVEYVRGLDEIDLRSQPAPTAQRAREEICAILKNQVGHDFSGYKERTFLRRVERRMQIVKIGEIESYIEHLRANPDEVSLLLNDLLINVTSFFRDEEAFAALAEAVVPRLFEGKGGAAETVRVWVPGCATGEEAYSLAILLCEFLEGRIAAPKVQIFATDIDDAALGVARAGRYPATLIEGMSPKRLSRYFSHDGASYVISKQLRDMCIFSAHSVNRDPPFSRIDLISCRNLLIYFDLALQQQILPMFHYALREGGFLFLGSAENVTQHEELFAPLDKKRRIFQRRDHVVSPIHLPMFTPGTPVHRSAPRGERGAGAAQLRQTVEGWVLDRFAPAYVVVNRECDIVFYSSHTGKYLEAAPGYPNRQLLATARRGLRLDLRAALKEAMENRRTVERVGITFETDEYVQLIDLVVEPLPDQDHDPLFLVLFKDVRALSSPEEAASQLCGTREGDTALALLEVELRETRERLQSSIEEYETALEEVKSSNEELVSVNEELQSTNEELETSKEELQSLNEELFTVNHELNVKIDELARAHGDLRNLFESTEVATVFLGPDLLIRSFTPAASRVFNFIKTDHGRPLTDIAMRIDYPELLDDIETTRKTETTVERRVRDHEAERHYLARLLPYRGEDRKVIGVVVTFFDVTDLVAAERDRLMTGELNHRIKNLFTVVTAIARQTLAHHPEPKKFGETFLDRLQSVADTYHLVSARAWGEVPLGDLIALAVEPFAGSGDGRIASAGPPITLAPQAALGMSMILHELTTNAMKYGALSQPSGRVDIVWTLAPADDAKKLELHWNESGGPKVAPPSRRGFGGSMIERQMSYQFDGTLETDFAEEGLRVTLTIPARNLGTPPAQP